MKTEYTGLLNHTSDISWVPDLVPGPVLGEENKEVSKAHHPLRQFMAQSRESANFSPGAQSHPRPVFVRQVPGTELSSPSRVG